MDETAGLSDLIMTYVSAWAPPVLVYLLLRVAAVRQTVKHMWKSAQEKMPEPFKSEPAEYPNPVELRVETYDASLNIDIDDVTTRGRWNTAMRIGVRSWWTYFFSLAVLVLVALLITRLVQPADPAAFPGPGLAAMFPVALIGVSLFFLLFIGSRAYLLGYVPRRSAFLSLIVLGLIGGLMSWIYDVSWFVSLLPGVVAVVLFLILNRKMGAHSREAGNQRLLILRLFDADANTVFTFGELARRWRFIGSTMTIADPSYLRFRYSFAYPRAKIQFLRSILFVGLGAAVLSYVLGWLGRLRPESSLALYALTHAQRVDLFSVVAWVLIIPFLAIPLVLVIRKRFISSPVTLEMRLHDVENDKVSRDETFRDFALYCHTDSWKPTIHELIKRSGVVLMDLRGLDEERAGSLYEIGLIVDTYPLSRVILLADKIEEKAYFEAMFAERLKNAAADSPNRHEGILNLRVFVPGSYEPRDTSRLLAILMAATKPEAVAGLTREAGMQTPWERFKAWYGRFGQWRRRLAERLDMLLARPPMSRAVLPMLAIVTVSLLWYRVGPVVAAVERIKAGPMEIEFGPAATVTDGDSSGTVIYAMPLSGAEEPVETYVFNDAAANSDSYGFRVGMRFRTGPSQKAIEYGAVEISSIVGDAGQTLIVNSIKGIRGAEISEDLAWTRAGLELDLILFLDAVEGINSIDRIEGTVLFRLPDPGRVRKIPLSDMYPVGVTTIAVSDMGALKVMIPEVEPAFSQEVCGEMDGEKFCETYTQEAQRQLTVEYSENDLGDAVINGYDATGTSISYSFRSTSRSMEGKNVTYLGFDMNRMSEGGISITVPGDSFDIRQTFLAENIPVKHR